jgi:hypothetical protein
MATASLVRSILWLLLSSLGLMAVVLGIMVLVQGRQGHGIATAAICLGDSVPSIRTCQNSGTGCDLHEQSQVANACPPHVRTGL